jgi:phosphoribosylformylglycinamidine cyclo-ligase
MKHVPVKGMAHITGGGLLENIPRILPEGLTAILKKETWEMPPLFAWLQQEGNVADSEMHRVFNCGIGMVVIVASEHIDAATQLLQSKGEIAWRIGTIRERRADEARTIIE